MWYSPLYPFLNICRDFPWYTSLQAVIPFFILKTKPYINIHLHVIRQIPMSFQSLPNFFRVFIHHRLFWLRVPNIQRIFNYIILNLFFSPNRINRLLRTKRFFRHQDQQNWLISYYGCHMPHSTANYILCQMKHMT